MGSLRPNHNAAMGGARVSDDTVRAIRALYNKLGSMAKVYRALRTTPGTIQDALAGMRMQRATVERLEAALRELGT